MPARRPGRGVGEDFGSGETQDTPQPEVSAESLTGGLELGNFSPPSSPDSEYSAVVAAMKEGDRISWEPYRARIAELEAQAESEYQRGRRDATLDWEEQKKALDAQVSLLLRRLRKEREKVERLRGRVLDECPDCGASLKSYWDDTDAGEENSGA